MITPELQKFISEQRSQGVPDTQIRQNLASGGWSASDLDEAMGVQQLANTYSSQVAAKSASGYGLWSVLIVVVLVVLGLGGYVFYKSQLVKNNFDNSKISQDNVYFPTNANDYNNMQGQKACGDWPQVDPSYQALFHVSSTIPANSADFPAYPGSVFVGLTDVYGGLVFCSSDDVKTIYDYYANYSGGVWGKSDLGSQYVPPEMNTMKPAWTKDYQVFYLGKKDGSANLNIGIAESAGKSVILLVATKKY